MFIAKGFAMLTMLRTLSVGMLLGLLALAGPFVYAQALVLMENLHKMRHRSE